MATTLTIISGVMKIEGVYSNPVFVTASNSNFRKDNNLEYFVYDKILGLDHPIGNAANVNGGISDAALEGLLSGFFSNSGGGASAVTSVFTRTGDVAAAADDYTKEQITGLKTTDSPSFAGYKDADVTTAVKLGDVSNAALATTNKTLIGATNELKDTLDNFTDPLLFKGEINIAADFPTIAEVEVIVTADCLNICSTLGVVICGLGNAFNDALVIAV